MRHVTDRNGNVNLVSRHVFLTLLLKVWDQKKMNKMLLDFLLKKVISYRIIILSNFQFSKLRFGKMYTMMMSSPSRYGGPLMTWKKGTNPWLEHMRCGKMNRGGVQWNTHTHTELRVLYLVHTAITNTLHWKGGKSICLQQRPRQSQLAIAGERNSFKWLSDII